AKDLGATSRNGSNYLQLLNRTSGTLKHRVQCILIYIHCSGIPYKGSSSQYIHRCRVVIVAGFGNDLQTIEHSTMCLIQAMRSGLKMGEYHTDADIRWKPVCLSFLFIDSRAEFGYRFVCE
uniref:Uncharacterized protein n=1 Tax=Aegilops tauschii subsp. strangulata TaxID=200361 RepID=A0A453HPT8_AEGTS